MATTVTAIANIRPVASPLLAPFKSQVTTLADLGDKTIFGFSNHEFKVSALLAKLLCVTLIISIISPTTLRLVKRLLYPLQIKVGLRDKAQGYLMCEPLAGIEPATLPLVRGMLYPMSYSGTQFGI